MASGGTTYTRTFANTYSVSDTSGTLAFISSGNTPAGTSLGTETLGYTSSTISYTGSKDSSIADSGSFKANAPEYVGAVVSGGTIIGYLFFDTGASKYYIVSDSTITSTQLASASIVSSDTLTICFMAGTMIATPAGEAAVETLKAGDLVTLADGRTAPVLWLGRQTVSAVFADPLRVHPIRIKANALADGVPSRDLLTSPDHAILVDGILVHASALVNGRSIIRESEVPETFTYYHVEVAEHALILAENTPAETFIDNVDRMAFDNWDEHAAIVGETSIPEMEYPRAKSARQIPTATRMRLAARADEILGASIATAAA